MMSTGNLLVLVPEPHIATTFPALGAARDDDDGVRGAERVGVVSRARRAWGWRGVGAVAARRRGSSASPRGPAGERLPWRRPGPRRRARVGACFPSDARFPSSRPLVSSSRSLTRPPSSQTQTSPPAAVTREELGRATWLFLHTLAAQFPDDPTRQQEKDARDLIHILTRVYPCEVCAAHFAEIVKRNPPDTSSGMALQQWACAAHNEVNASLGKPAFDCAAVASRWAGLDCGSNDDDGCSLENRRAKGRGGGGGASQGGGRARIDTY